MNNPICAYCLAEIESPKDSTVGMFFDKLNHKVEAYCLCKLCARDFRNGDELARQLVASCIEQNLKVEGVSLDPKQQPLIIEGK